MCVCVWHLVFGRHSSPERHTLSRCVCTHACACSYFGLTEQELQVSSAQDAVVLDVAGQVHSAAAVDGRVHLHVRVDDVQVLLFILENKSTKYIITPNAREITYHKC